MSLKQILAQIFRRCDQSDKLYAKNIERMLNFLEDSSHQQLTRTLQDMDFKPSQNEIVYLYSFLLQNKGRLGKLTNILYNQYLVNFQKNSYLVVLIVFMQIVQSGISNVASDIYNNFKSNMYSCCSIYQELLSWLKVVYLDKIILGFVQFWQNQKLLEGIEQPLKDHYQTELTLKKLFCQVQSRSANVQNFLIYIKQRYKNIEQMLGYYQQAFKHLYLQKRLQQMIALKKQIFQSPYTDTVLKAYCCHTIGDLLRKRINWFEAIDYLKEALEYAKYRQPIQFKIAECYFKLENWNQVFHTLKYFFQPEQNEKKQMDDQQYSQAYAMYAKAQLSMTTTKKQINFNKHQTSSTVLSQGDIDYMLLNAIQHSELALQFDPNNMLANQTLGLIQIQYFREFEQARLRYQNLLKTVAQQHKNQVLVLLTYSTFLHEDPQVRKKAQNYLQAVDLQGLVDCFDFDFLPKLIQTYRPDLFTNLQASLQCCNFDFASTMVKRGVVARKQKKFDNAICYFNFSLKKLKDNIICKVQLARCFKMKKMQASALRLYDQVREKTEDLTVDCQGANKKVIFKEILQLYLQLLDKNNQRIHIEVTKVLAQMQTALRRFQEYSQQKDSSDVAMIQRVKQKQNVLNHLPIYLNLLKIYMQHRLQAQIASIHTQIKPNVINCMNKTQKNILLAFHRGDILCELDRFDEAQKQLINFLRQLRKDEAKKSYNLFKKEIEKAYVLMCSVYSQNRLQRIPYRFMAFGQLDVTQGGITASGDKAVQIFEQLLDNSVISSYEAYQKIGLFFLDNKRLQSALYYLREAFQICKTMKLFKTITQTYNGILQQPDSFRYKQLLKEFVVSSASCLQDKEDYRYAIDTCKILKDFQLTERYYLKLIQIQVIKKENTTKTTLQLADCYLSFNQFQRAGRLISQIFLKEPSLDLLEELAKVVNPQNNKDRKQICSSILSFYEQNNCHFIRAVIYNEFQFFSSSFAEQCEFIKQLKFIPLNELKKEVEKRFRILKSFTQNTLNKIFQLILYSEWCALCPNDKTISTKINRNILPNLYANLKSTEKYFGYSEVSLVSQLIGEAIAVEHKALIFKLMHNENKRLEKQNKNQFLAAWIANYDNSLTGGNVFPGYKTVNKQ